jgi:hypothetical protein
MWVWVGFEQARLRIMFVIIYLRFFLILTTNILDYPDPLQYDYKIICSLIKTGGNYEKT